MIHLRALASSLKLTDRLVPVVVVVLLLFSASDFRTHDVHKFVAPGVYDLYLTKGLKRVYYFWVWTSKGVQVQSDPNPRISLLDEKRKKLDLIDSTRIKFFDESFRKGDLIGYVEIAHSGIYRVEAVSKGVFVICGQDEAYLGLGSDYVFSDWDNDWYFERPLSASPSRS